MIQLILFKPLYAAVCNSANKFSASVHHAPLFLLSILHDADIFMTFMELVYLYTFESRQPLFFFLVLAYIVTLA